MRPPLFEVAYRVMSNDALAAEGRRLLAERFTGGEHKQRMLAVRAEMQRRIDELLRPEPPLSVTIVDYGARP